MENTVVRSWLKTPLLDHRVLIVEDQLLIALDLQDSIAQSNAGADVVGFASQKEHALRLGPTADIAFVDVNLADGPTGPEIGRILAEQFGVTVIFMTANPEALGAGVAGTLGVISKPVSQACVEQALAFAIARRTDQLATVPSQMRLFNL
jgi:DNA-binding NarL/FixJ family response regulator